MGNYFYSIPPLLNGPDGTPLPAADVPEASYIPPPPTPSPQLLAPVANLPPSTEDDIIVVPTATTRMRYEKQPMKVVCRYCRFAVTTTVLETHCITPCKQDFFCLFILIISLGLVGVVLFIFLPQLQRSCHMCRCCITWRHTCPLCNMFLGQRQ